jgi:hypothetical protein
MYKGANEAEAHINPALPTDKPNERTKFEGQDHLELG